MKPSEALELNRIAIREIVADNHASNPRVFGSVLHGTDTESSDLDILIDPDEGATLLDVGTIYRKLNELLGVEVQVLTPRALPDSFRDIVLSEAVAI